MFFVFESELKGMEKYFEKDHYVKGLDIIAETRQKIAALTDLEQYLQEDINTLSSSQRSLLNGGSNSNIHDLYEGCHDTYRSGLETSDIMSHD